MCVLVANSTVVHFGFVLVLFFVCHFRRSYRKV
jgi:hypothetical protein